MELKAKSDLYRDGDVVDWVYFPKTCLLSLIAGWNARGVETSMVGSEGAAGLVEACGSRKSRSNALVRVGGQAWRAPPDLCRDLALTDSDFAAAVLKLAELQLAEARRAGYCQTRHTAPQRIARWLAESIERSGLNPLPVTQDTIAATLGLARTSVTMHALELQRQAVIRYRRGYLEIADPERLGKLSCDCRAYAARQRSDIGLEPATAKDNLDLQRRKAGARG